MAMHVPRVPLDLRPLMGRDQSGALEYDQFLSQLTFNSKEIINSLTRVAGDNKNMAPALCFVLEFRILSAPPDKSLPLIYLMDSIIKNIGSPFRELFAARVAMIIPQVYFNSSLDTCTRLRKLIKTWHGVLGTSIVERINSECDIVDRSKGISSTNPAGIHANPQYARGNIPGMMNALSVPQPGTNTAAILSKMEQETRALVEFISVNSQRGIPPTFEMVQHLQTLINSQLQLVTDHQVRHNLMLLSSNIASMLPQQQPMSLPVTNAFGPQPIPQIVAPQTALRSSTPTVAAPIQLGFQPTSSAAQMSVSNAAKPSVNETPTQSSIELCPSFSKLKTFSHSGAVSSLYSALPNVSKMDGCRFVTRDELREHLDWLFEYNKKRRITGLSRPWYASELDWISGKKDTQLTGADVAAIFDRSTNVDSHQRSGDSEKKQNELNVSEEMEVVEAVEGEEEMCEICGDGFETVWDDGNQSWMLKGAMKVRDSDDESNTRLFHVRCHRVSTSPRMHSVTTKRNPEFDQISYEHSKKLKIDHRNT